MRIDNLLRPHMRRYEAYLIRTCDNILGYRPCHYPILDTQTSRSQLHYHRIDYCQFRHYPKILNFLSHYPNPAPVGHPRLVCEGCRFDNHFTVETGGLLWGGGAERPYNAYLDIIQRARIEVCLRCDNHQRHLHPAGSNFCNCYERYFRKRWLCHQCDQMHIAYLDYKVMDRKALIHGIVQRGKHMKFHYHARRLNIPCPCRGRQLAQNPGVAPTVVPMLQAPIGLQPPSILRFLDANKSISTPNRVMQCILCTGYIIPPTPPHLLSRRSARIRNNRTGTTSMHEMLNRRGRAAPTNGQGFPEI